jgi:hypothetical protein
LKEQKSRVVHFVPFCFPLTHAAPFPRTLTQLDDGCGTHFETW